MERPPAKISYVNKSYHEARQELLSRAPIVSNGLWTDLNNAELLVSLLELVLGIGDMQTFYLDHQANEAFLPTARERKNVIRLTSQIGYRMKSWSSAVGTVTVELVKAVSGYVHIPKYTLFRAESGTPYYVTRGTYLHNAEPVATIPLAQGLPDSVVYMSDGFADQSFVIPYSDVAENSIEVTVADNVWEIRDDNFVKSGPYSMHCTLRIDEENRFHIVFGDGISGMIPPAGSVITIRFAHTKGPLGALSENSIRSCDLELKDFRIVGSSRFSGGAMPETIEEAKKLAPMNLRALWRAVHKDDFVALAESYPGIRQAAVLDINDFPLYSFEISYHEVWVVAIPEDGEVLSDQLRSDLEAYLDERRYVTCDVKVIDPEYIYVDVEALVYRFSTYDSRVILARVEDVLRELFKVARSPLASRKLTGSVDGRVLGEDFRVSKLISVLQSIEGVSHVSLIYPTEDIRVNYRQIVRLGEVRVNVLSTREEFGTPE